MTKFNVQVAHGAHVELNHFDQIEWHTTCFGWEFKDAIKEVDSLICMTRDGDDTVFADCYEAVRDEIAPAKHEALYREILSAGELIFTVDGREHGWRIVKA